jgi:hypothetical protein
LRNLVAVIRNRIRRELLIGGIAAVQHVDRRLLPVIDVNPLLIEHQHPRYLELRGPMLGPKLFRDDLDFESNLISIEAFETCDVRPRFFREVFISGLSLRETTEFQYHMEKIARQGRTWYGFSTDTAVLRYLEGKVQLFEDIRRAGEVRPSREISGKRRDETGCLIDHRGRLVKGENGNNRFAIARMLQIQSVPVHIDAIDAGQIPIVRQFPGLTPIAKINRYLLGVQERYAQRPSPGRGQDLGGDVRAPSRSDSAGSTCQP